MKPHFLLAVFPFVAAVGCKQEVDLYCDENKPCDDPVRPFCDLEGEYEASNGFSNTCIPAPFEDDAGVQAACAPNESACDGDQLVTCDSTGRVAETIPCPAGCFHEGARCYEFQASNGLTPFIAAAAETPALQLSEGAEINTTAGTIVDGDGTVVAIPTKLLSASADGVAVRVFMASSAELDDVLIYGGPAFALVASGPIKVVGDMRTSTSRARGAPGAVESGPCTGKNGGGDLTDDGFICAGGGGGGFATAGASGGDAEFYPDFEAGNGGSESGNAEIEPLRGGCSGGSAYGGPAGIGGGALQIVSATKLTITGGIIAAGQGAPDRQQGDLLCGGGGGGSGGAILLESPALEIASTATVIANGGSGGCSNGNGADGQTATPAPGGCPEDLDAGGSGGTGTVPPQSGGTASSIGGGGGGSAGRIRLNASPAGIDAAGVVSPPPTTGIANRL